MAGAVQALRRQLPRGVGQPAHLAADAIGEQKPLQGRLATRPIGGMDLPQWQFDISSGARLIYCVDEGKRTVWLVDASAAHPGATVAKGKRSSTNR